MGIPEFTQKMRYLLGPYMHAPEQMELDESMLAILSNIPHGFFDEGYVLDQEQDAILMQNVLRVWPELNELL